MGALFCKQEVVKEPKLPPYDFYRCGYLRYMGFASVIASTMVPKTFAHIPQMAATAYVFSDVFSKTIASVENDDRQERVIITAVDAILWQGMASVLAPILLYGSLRTVANLMFPIKPIKMPPLHKASNQKCNKSTAKVQHAKRRPAFVKLLPGTISLLLMPYIVRPIQCNVDDFMNNTYRKWIAEYLYNQEKECKLSEEDRKEQEKARKLRAQQEEKEAKEKQIKLKEAEKLAAEQAKQKAKEEELARKQRIIAEKEAKERARLKCLENVKVRREQLAAEEREMKEKIKQEEAEFIERKAKLEKEFKEKAQKKVECD